MGAHHYSLTASRGDRSTTVTVEVFPDRERARRLQLTEQDELDSSATMDAIARVLDRASSPGQHRDLWALGAIRLARPDGTVIHEMEAKD